MGVFDAEETEAEAPVGGDWAGAEAGPARRAVVAAQAALVRRGIRAFHGGGEMGEGGAGRSGGNSQKIAVAAGVPAGRVPSLFGRDGGEG